MENRYLIITGTSRGIGRQLAELCLEQGDVVYGIARGTSDLGDTYERYTHVQFDVEDIHSIDDLISGILEQIPLLEVQSIGLINNAAMLEPLKPIDQCLADEISVNLNISLAAPMIFTSSFIHYTNHMTAQRNIINVSSGSGSYAAPFMAVYCTSKAGINMFTQCVAMEQASQPNPVQIIAFDPGMVDTELQAVARDKDAEEFALSSVFQEAYESGQLKSPREVAQDILKLLEESGHPSIRTS
ncbi:SDR family NAD(P)-dependent oxidoreductase [Paenibacillus barcinonensis]|uniref:Benzil reductase ((S)-benzoin forming) n=1 Tax=Paenibacillus barcinonensis TaxID=198119 RepID=A0A2V4WJY2_PAEBA|nr:SDR family NAD(P)-dependent oxidoreductase [Paenibacillus barcinonensis]PYE47776.1 benzil reductase ((S)-benzoin forming) [Paenibacillus barcinonensis]QKS59112.1 SDR family NAD(P)-dependent oxidoreductase [Paenibacillus barcinonensis]